MVRINKNRSVFIALTAIFLPLLLLAGCGEGIVGMIKEDVNRALGPATYTLTLDDSPNGTVTAQYDTIVYQEGESFTVIQGEEITLEAVAEATYAFADWTYSGGVVNFDNKASPTATVTLNSASASIQASFLQNVFELDLLTSGDGSGVFQDGTGNTISGTINIESGVPKQITAVAGANCTFDGWSANGSITTNTIDADTIDVTCTGDAQLTAEFNLNIYTLTLTVNNASGGTVSPPTKDVPHGVPEPIQANPSSPYVFIDWVEVVNPGNSAFDSGYTATSNPAAVLLVGDATLQARFFKIPDPPDTISLSSYKSSKKIRVNWTCGATDEDGFHVYRDGTSSGNLVGTTGPNTTTYTNTYSGFQPNTRYYYYVKSYNLAGESAYKTTSVWTPDVPGAPYNFTGVSKATGQVSLGWSAADDEHYNFHIWAFHPVLLTWGELGETASTQTTLSLGPDSSGATIRFKVQAWNAYGSAYSSEIQVTIQ